MTTTAATRTVLHDAETGERIATSNPVRTPEDAKTVKGWALRYRTAYGRRTGHKVRVTQEPAPAATDDGWCPTCGTEIKYGRSYCSECAATR